MKKASDYIKNIYPFTRVIIKDIGNRGYYILYKNYDFDNCYDFISINTLVRYACNYENSNKRKMKLLTIKWQTENYLEI